VFIYFYTGEFDIGTYWIAAGEFVAVVGPSGAGKTTLVDMILGIKKSEIGNVKIGGQDVSETLDKWPGAISYVPQSVSVFNGSIRENISIGYSADEVADTLIIDSLKFASLYDFILSLDDGINTKIGENGANLSGGQKQRLGIARAMISKPKLLILDEATSALDGQIELDISESLNDLKKEMTLIVVAHRLSTVRKADKVVYLENGKIVCSGTFEEVRKNVPNFEKQATLMGL
jgi:ABC-type multidrug transport system fused ATPase/permease subunit